jgi:hypothetical protein
LTCRKWRFLLATEEADELAENAALQAHLASCGACAEFAREMAAVRRATRALPRLTAPPGFGAEVRRRTDDRMEAAALQLIRAHPALLCLADAPSQPLAVAVAVVLLGLLLSLLLAYRLPVP